MKPMKQSVEKETLVELIGEDTLSFLNRIDRLGNNALSEGKWNKLYAICAEARKRTGENYYVYASPNLHDYDTSTHRTYPHLMDDRTPLWRAFKPDPRR
jgi:hypothetical protein